MHPILFHIPLPGFPLKLWWGLVLVAAFSVLSATLAGVRRQTSDLATSAIVVVAALMAAWHWRSMSFDARSLPIYAYGVMLSLSLIAGWYITLPLAEKDGLPKETMANCYVVTALSALAGSRILYAFTNPDEFHSAGDLLAIRNGGLVAYGGFIGGLLGSWAFLAPRKIRLLAWADDAVPSLASGLLLTRLGCYLFGCDFGKRLPEGAPHWLKTLGTFPHWPSGTMVVGEGSPAFVRHLELYRGTPLETDLVQINTSFPVHPTQLYESLVGAVLLGLLMWQRKHTRFRGQVFFLFVFAYGFLRFLLELWRDDVERGNYGPILDAHILVPLCLMLFAVAFVFGVSLGITNPVARRVARVLAFVPAVVVYLWLRPASFAPTDPYQLSTSQIIGLLSALIVAYFYARFWADAGKHPVLAMSLGDSELLKRPSMAAPSRAQADRGDSEDAGEHDEPQDDAAPADGKAQPGGAV
jgi:phosphatidylglycerol---prolipoprotein diacylglyceryl transferase